MFQLFKEKIIPGSLESNDDFIKGLPRYLECILAFCGLLALSPLLILCVLLVRVSSAGPLLFRQNRVGRGGKVFTLYKFRTMFVARKGLLITAKTDRRITSVGKFLRKTKLDELPELYNVLRGDMSFVGPRPEVVEFVDFANPLWEKILAVRPGITDPVTLRLRNEESFLACVVDKEKFYREVIQPYKLNGYTKYLKVKSSKNDLKIIVKTFKVILLPKTVPPPSTEELKLSCVE